LTLGISCLTFLPMNTKSIDGASFARTRSHVSRLRYPQNYFFTTYASRDSPPRGDHVRVRDPFQGCLELLTRRSAFYQRPLSRKSRVACEVNSEIGERRQERERERKIEREIKGHLWMYESENFRIPAGVREGRGQIFNDWIGDEVLCRTFDIPGEGIFLVSTKAL